MNPENKNKPVEVRPELLADVLEQLEANVSLQDVPLMPLAWIERRSVTYEELEAVRARVALIVRGYLALQPAEQIAFITRGVLTSRPMPKPNA